MRERFFDILQRNLPRTKPQLWANLPRALLRLAELRLRSRLDPRWVTVPHRVSLNGPGMLMDVFVRDSIGRSVFVYGVYEVLLTRFLRRVLPAGGVLVDVGANAGYHTLVAASAVGPTGAVHSFEPSATLRERLSRNVSLNGLRNVAVHAQAVWSGAKEVPFHETIDPGNSGISSVLPGVGRSERAVTVPATTLDTVAAEIGRCIDVVKIDVEGGEKQVFAGAKELLASDRPPIIAFESFEPLSVVATLREAGWEVGTLSYGPRSGFQVRASLSTDPDDPFAAYEAPTYVAVKANGTGSMASLAERFAA